MIDNKTKEQKQQEILERGENKTNKVLKLLLKEAIDKVKIDNETYI